jgi:hypothetical protein
MKLSGRVRTLPGDFHFTEIPANQFDCVVLANVLHLDTPEQAAALIRRVTVGLTPNGELLIVGYFEDDSSEDKLGRALRNLHLALRTEQGCNHSLSNICS